MPADSRMQQWWRRVKARLAAVLRNGVAIILALLLLATCFVWASSYQSQHVTSHYDRPRVIEVRSANGRVTVAWGKLTGPRYVLLDGWQKTSRLGGVVKLGEPAVFGFGLSGHRQQWGAFGADLYLMTVPWWAICLGLLLATLLADRLLMRVRERRRRRAAGLCTACGYDLRESPERCPECGQLATK